MSFHVTPPAPMACPREVAIRAIRLRDPRCSISYLSADGVYVARVWLTSGGTVTVMPDAEIVGDLEAELARTPPPPRIVVAQPGEYADSFEQGYAEWRDAYYGEPSHG